jgi:hypothetical protein
VYLPAVGLALVRTAVWGRRLAARTRPWCDPLDLVVLAFWLTLAAQLLTWFGVSGVIRYSLTFLGPLPLLVTAALGRLAGTGRAGRAAAIALAGALLAFNLAGHVAFIRAGAAAPRRPVDAAIGRMQALGLTACYADSRISQVLSFESAGRIRCADYGGLRDYASLQAVDRVEEPGSVAIVTHRVLRNPEPGEMARALARIGAAFERTAVGDYVIFHRFVLPRPPARPVPSAGWRARASARPEAAALAFDRRDWTRWAVPNRAGEWFELDLGRVHAVTQVTLAAAPWPADTPSGLRVEVSADGIHWETAASDSGLLPGLHWWKGHPRMDDGGRIILRFSPRRGRYLRLTSVGTPRPGASWGLSELFVGEAAPAPWSPPAAAISALAAAARELDRWMDDPTGSHPARSPVTMEHRRNQVPWARALAEANTALAAAPEWDEPHHLYGLALARFGWSDGSERALDRAQRQGASLEVVRLAELIDSQPDAAWRAGRLSAWAEALERLGRPTDAAAIRARPEPVPARPVYVRFGPNLELVGVDGPAEARAGETVRLSYHWRLRGAAPHDPWVFLHVLGWDGARNHDQPVGQIEFGPSRWVAGDRVRQTLAFTVPPGTAPGAYSLRAGVWLPSTGRRLRILASDLPQTRHAVDLGTLVVVP